MIECAATPADRAIAHANVVDVNLDLESDSSAMAGSSVDHDESISRRATRG
jgi:hypothetical protein